MNKEEGQSRNWSQLNLFDKNVTGLFLILLTSLTTSSISQFKVHLSCALKPTLERRNRSLPDIGSIWRSR